MSLISRRSFLGASLAGLAAAPLLRAERIEALPAIPADPAFQPDTLFLTWQRAPTTTMTIQWVGPDGQTADTAVYYSAATGADWFRESTAAKSYPLTDLTLFRCELTGLEPGTDYRFRIGPDSPEYRFRTMPSRATDTISFISGGDCGVNEYAVANNIQAARQDPMFALIGGDLGYDNGKSSDTSLAFLRNYSGHMRGLGGRLIPMVACIGNHEVDGGYGQPRDKAPFFYALFDGLFTETGYATLDFGDYLSLVLLDSGHTSEIGGAQADWLETTLQERRDHPHVIAVNHVPAYPSYRKMQDDDGSPGAGARNREFWVPHFEKYRVPVVLEHHDHTFKRSKPLLGGLAHDNGVLYLGDGSWGKLRVPKSPEELPFLAKTSGEYHLSLHRLEGDERFHLALNDQGRVMDVCRTGQRTVHT